MYFIKIKPNSDKNINSVLSENILKLLNINNCNINNCNISIDSTSDMIDIIEEYIIEISNEDPIKYINSYFANINKLDDLEQFYDVQAINKTDNTYNLLLVNNYLNTPSMIDNLSDIVKQNNFNLIASSLSQYYNNSIAIFGDAFLININSSYFEILENIAINKQDQDKLDEKKILTLESTLSKYTKIYYDYKYYNLFCSMADIYFINIYVQPLNKTVIYCRGILNTIIQDYTSKDKLDIINKNIIKINYNDLILYIKITDILPNSHNHIILMIDDTSDSYYLTNIQNNDIELILKNI